MTTAFQLRIELRDFKPAIYRDVLVDPATPLPKLHKLIQAAMGWEDVHINGSVVETDTPLPHLLKAQQGCPPEDCGGPGGAEYWASVWHDKNHADHAVAQTMPEPRTSDGRAFSTLSNQELEKLSKSDQDAYEAWLDAVIARGKAEAKEREIRMTELKTKAKAQDEENARLTEQINAVCLSTTASFRKLHEAGNRSAAYIEVKSHLKKAVVQNQSYLKDCLDPISADAKLKAAIL